MKAVPEAWWMRGSVESVIRRGRASAAALLACALYSFLPGVAHAELSASQKIYVQKLKDSSSDVRLSAALSLGSANDDDAVQPLCGALSDSEE